jgi:MscS family membrane protein
MGADASRRASRFGAQPVNETFLGGFARSLQATVPSPFLQAVVALALAVAAARAADLALALMLRPLLTRLVPTAAAERLGGIVRRAAYHSIILGGLLVAATALSSTVAAEQWIVAAARTVVAIIWVVAIIQGATVLLGGLSESPTAPSWASPSAIPLINSVLRVTLALVATYGILVAWEVNVTGLVASAGILGIALSFAAQDTLSNLFAGAAIMIDQPYRVGDYIVLDSGERGQVTYVGLRSTRLVTRDDEEVSIPNGVIGRAKIINESGGPEARFRVRVQISIAYGSDIDQVMAVLLAVAANHASISRQPEPRVRLRAFGESGIAFELLAWITNPAQRGLVVHELNCDVYRAFGREGIVIPVPQREVHIRDHRAE